MPELEMLGEALPFLIPLVIAQFSLFGVALYHILTHKNYKRGNRALWIVISCINFIGPIAYFVFGKEDS
jgi:hypothetical protein